MLLEYARESLLSNYSVTTYLALMYVVITYMVKYRGYKYSNSIMVQVVIGCVVSVVVNTVLIIILTM
jgi:hypothetical protein